MATVEFYSNEKCLPLPNQAVPFPVHANYHRTIAEAQQFTGNEPTTLLTNIAVIPCEGDKRIVVLA
ncbi:hypothetical protein [Thaumasiovibrio subtropicus]|uniref:hypothetical protein n=1 Tax=Thaumasiovibrio subtropicus TaxID=1891207 RepID=UPI000B359E11|nr:hypothetical protein [Thaumasiovibrio subtropicus]